MSGNRQLLLVAFCAFNVNYTSPRFKKSDKRHFNATRTYWFLEKKKKKGKKATSMHAHEYPIIRLSDKFNRNCSPLRVTSISTMHGNQMDMKIIYAKQSQFDKICQQN